jgi:hypothetical protein
MCLVSERIENCRKAIACQMTFIGGSLRKKMTKTQRKALYPVFTF